MVGDGNGGFVFPELHPAFDGMFALMKLLESLARYETKLSEVVTQLPPYHLIRTQVNCPWEYKGKVMRMLSEQYREQRRQPIDGVKIDLGRRVGARPARCGPSALPCAGGVALARFGAGAGRQVRAGRERAATLARTLAGWNSACRGERCDRSMCSSMRNWRALFQPAIVGANAAGR